MLTDSDKLEEVRLGVARLEGSIRTLAASCTRNAEDIKKLEGRVWGLVIMTLGSFGTALSSFVVAGGKAQKVAVAAQHMFGWLF